jgi:hypothetical protein
MFSFPTASSNFCRARGFGLRNPLVAAFSTCRTSYRDSGEHMDRAFDMEMKRYEQFKHAWESGDDLQKRAPATRCFVRNSEAGERSGGYECYDACQSFRKVVNGEGKQAFERWEAGVVQYAREVQRHGVMLGVFRSEEVCCKVSALDTR